MELASIGYFIKTHGVKGQIILKIEHQFKEKDVKVLFIETATGKAPFFVNGFKNNNHGLIFSLEEIISVEQAKKLIGKVVFIAKNILIEKEEEFDWLDYILIDKSLGEIGKIESVSNNGQQLLLKLNYKNKEILLPLVDSFIEKIDHDHKKLFFNAPDGLINLYLSEE